MSSQEKTNLDVLRAHGRCTGALIFSIFGGCWFLLSAAYFHRFHFIVTTPIVVALCLLSFAAWQLQRSQPPAVLEGSLGTRKQADDRAFMIINAVTYTTVFFLFLILPRFGLQNYIFPGFVALIGLHFFPMPPLYRYTANFITGAALIVWACHLRGYVQVRREPGSCLRCPGSRDSAMGECCMGDPHRKTVVQVAIHCSASELRPLPV